MIPKITAGGRSFKGAAAYYLHDKNKTTRERVAWTETINVLTDDPDKAWKVMAYTAKEAERLKEASGQKMTGRKLTKPVFAYSLAWHPEQQPGREHMLETAKKSLQVLGLSEHEAIIIAHRDEPQQHVHILVNRVHSLTGLASDTTNSKLKLSDFAREYEREHGKIYCPQREDNYRKRMEGEKTMYRDSRIVEAWKQSDNGRGFASALKDKGYHLAQGRKRLVVVDPYGQSLNPVRHLENVRAKQFNERVADLDLSRLPDATDLSRSIQKDNRRRYDESRRHDERLVHQKNQMQSRHLEQRAHLANRFEDKLSGEREQLEQQYKLAAQKEEIGKLQNSVSTPRWWKRLLGVTRKEQARLVDLERNLENAQGRCQERLDAITVDREQALAKLKQRQETEKQDTLKRIDSERPEGYLSEAERERMLQHLKHRSQDRTRDGPSLER